MEPIIAVMLILGCDHSMMVCRQSPEPVRQYASVEACEADTQHRVREIDGYPVAVADCIEVKGIAPGQKVAIDWRLDAVGGLIADAHVDDGGRMTADAASVVADAGGV